MDQSAHEAQLLSLGRLSFLAAHCPLHRNFPARALMRLFVPAINHDCVRFFNNHQDQVCAALIWARLSDEVSERMSLTKTHPPKGIGQAVITFGSLISWHRLTTGGSWPGTSRATRRRSRFISPVWVKGAKYAKWFAVMRRPRGAVR